MKNLAAEMARKGVRVLDLQRILGCSEKTVRNKLNGCTSFSFSESLKIRDALFPGLQLEYLFALDAGAPADHGGIA